VESTKHSVVPLPSPSQSCFSRDVVVLHGVRQERRESERSLQSSKEWEDVVVVSAPCKLLICINTSVCLSKIISYLVLQCFHFCDFWMYFWPDFLSHDLRSFSSIPSVGLAARMSLIIYLQPWSESMALAPLIWWVSPISSKT
jgi:hypothetical protein